MAGTMFLRPTAGRVYPRTMLLMAGRTRYSVKRATLGYSTNEQWHKHIICKGSIYFSQSFLPSSSSWLRKSGCHILFKFINNCKNNNKLMLLSSKNTCRPLSYSFFRGTSHTNDTNSYGGTVDVKDNDHDNVATEKLRTDDAEFESLKVKEDSSTDFDDEFPKIQSETTEDEEDLFQQTKAVDSNLLDSSLHSTSVGKKSDFEYDYQVAEDIEEYDYIDESMLAAQQVRPEKVLPISLQRGKTGVFDLDELVTLLEHLGAMNIVTLPIPPEANFCDHMVVVSAKSQRHLQAINDEMLWVHKRKKSSRDPLLVIEGFEESTWCAMDIGNIVLHVFLGDGKRQYYDIESLWTLGPDHDPKCLEQHNNTYDLSPEDLFWLETKNSAFKVRDTASSDDTGTDGSDKVVEVSKT